MTFQNDKLFANTFVNYPELINFLGQQIFDFSCEFDFVDY